MLLRRLFQICQNGPVTEYIDQFVALVDELKAYAKHPDPLYYTQHFINGLRDEIKAVVLVQHPSTLDTACILAQLQEEAMGAIKRPYRRVDVLPGQKPAWPAPLPLPPPPPKLAIVDAPRVTEVTRVQLKKNSGHFVPLVVPVVCASDVVLSGAGNTNALRWFSYIWCKNCLICFLTWMMQKPQAHPPQQRHK